MRMMCVPTVLRTNVMALLFGFAVYAMVVINPQFVETPPSAGYGFGASVSEAGLYLLPSTLCILVASVASAGLADRFSGKTILIAGALTAGLGPVVLLVGHDHRPLIYVATGLFGTGVGLGFSSMSQLVVAAVPAEQTGIASGMNNNFRTIGGSIGTTVTAGIVAGGATVGGVPPEGGYVGAWVLIATLFVAAAVLAGMIPRRPVDAVRIGTTGPSLTRPVAAPVAASGPAWSVQSAILRPLPPPGKAHA
jgi:MFS family permease